MRRDLRASVPVFFFFFCVTTTGLAQSSATQANSTSDAPILLQGGVTHSERLAPVEPSLQAGAVFNEQSLPRLVPNNDWYWIPNWYAGQKHVESETILQDYDFRTGQLINPKRTVLNRQDLSIGFQMDSNGQIWEFKRAPYTTTVEGDNVFTTMIVRNRDPIRVAQEVVVIRLLQTSVIVDKASSRIINSVQEEQINTYTPSSPGIMNLQTSIRSFGADGTPQIEETSARIVYTRGPFQPINYYQGLDMRALFQNYLLSHGYSNLLPQNFKSIPEASRDLQSIDSDKPAGSSDQMPSTAPPFVPNFKR